MIELVLGGARSGKSRFAEQQAAASGLPVVYIATATAGDDEMAARIAHHRGQRPPEWACIEEPLALADTLSAHDDKGCTLLVDCLTLWTCNALFAPDPRTWEVQRQALLDTLPRLASRVILVSNETGWGITPMGAETRRYVDELGRLHQDIAALAQRVTLVVAGLPMTLKGTTP
jgi:adenosylcobinamide kinase/adenosylcobinamide-phosphate guanylyltransferase